MGDLRYAFSLTTFSPSGKLVQIEYALQAVSQGSTSLGIKGNFYYYIKFNSYVQSILFLIHFFFFVV